MGLSITNLYGGYAGQDVLQDVSLTVGNGQIVALIGLNGAGKSTTLKHVIGERPVLQGSIKLNDVDLNQQPAEFKQQLAYVPEQPILYPELTLAEHLHLMLASHGFDDQDHWQKVMTLLQTFRLTDKLHWLPQNFSKGMQQKVMLVSAFALEAPLMVIDEPFIGLDVLAQKSLIQLMRDRAQAGGAILLTTHLVTAAVDYVDQFVLLDQGKVVDQASPATLAERHQLNLSEMDELFEWRDKNKQLISNLCIQIEPVVSRNAINATYASFSMIISLFFSYWWPAPLFWSCSHYSGKIFQRLPVGQPTQQS